MNIYLRDEYRINPDLAKEIANKIEITRLTDVADIEMDLVNIYISIKPNKKTMEKKGITIDDLLERIQSVRKISAKIEKENINIKQVLPAKTASARKWFGPSLARLSSRKTRGKRIWETPGKDPGDRERPPGGAGGRESPRDKERILLHIFGDPLF